METEIKVVCGFAAGSESATMSKLPAPVQGKSLFGPWPVGRETCISQPQADQVLPTNSNTYRDPPFTPHNPTNSHLQRELQGRIP